MIFNEKQIRDQAEEDGVDMFGTGIAVFNDGKLLVVRRVMSDSLGGYFELPGGGVDEGETIYEGAVRELKEEAGLEAVSMLGGFEGFDYTTRSQKFIRQCNFIVDVASHDVVLDPNEHDEFLWIDLAGIEGLQLTDDQKLCLYNAFKRYESLQRQGNWKRH